MIRIVATSRPVWCGLGLALLLCACAAPPRPAAHTTVALQPAAPLPAPERWILVRKRAHTLTLYEGDKPIKTYAVVLGKEPYWAKLHQGDHRTPEGEYHISGKRYHADWSRFMLIDYPTAANREIYEWSRAHGALPIRGRAVPDIGGQIGIHGTYDDGVNRRGVDWTEGCISLFNRDVDELYDMVPVGTRVVIER